MSKEVIRKKNTYQDQIISLHEEFRISFMEFNNLIDDLVIQLKRIIRSLSSHMYNQNQFPNLLVEKETYMIESIFYKISKITYKTDEILQNIGGLEFSINSPLDEFTFVLRDIEIQYNHVIKFYNSLDSNYRTLIHKNKDKVDVHEFLYQLEIEFVLLQEVIQNSLPKVNLLFDEFKEKEINALKFNATNQF